MRFLREHITSLIVFTLLISTILNKFFVHDRLVVWKVSMTAIAIVLTFYSLNEYCRNKSRLNLIVLIIFAIELLAVLIGWNLSTHFYPEFIMALLIMALYASFKKWQKR